MNDVQEELCWAGPAMVAVFVIGAGNDPLPSQAFNVAGLVPDQVYPFVLEEQPPEIAALGLISYDLTFHTPSLDLHTYTREVLRRLCADGRAVAWAGYEGSFHYDHLLTEDIAHMLYGHCVSGAQPVTSWDRATLRSAAWKECLAEARTALVALMSRP
ncbi:hypothetical protein [Streptomyces sp. NPDC092307]|uniref:hypothetical protein n=1 Tax=Streptomyces sp. NPDC092307 TaxID=3366013 RepID=UPI00382B5930